MSRLDHYNIEQPKTRKWEKNKNQEPFPPWAFRDFTMQPCGSELEDYRDGETIETSTTVRFISRPYAFQQAWKAVPKRNYRKGGELVKYRCKETGEMKQSFSKRKFTKCGNLPGFDGRDVLQTLIDEQVAPLRERKKQGDTVTSEEWKAALEFAYEPMYAFELIDFRYHHFDSESYKDPYGNTQTKQVLKSDGGDNCPLRKASDPYVSKLRFGGRKHWVLRKSLFSDFKHADRKLSNFCVMKDGVSVKAVEYGKDLIGMKCPNCGSIEVTAEHLSGATDRKRMDWTTEKHTCKSCNHYGNLADIVSDEVDHRLYFQDVFWNIKYSAKKVTRYGKPSVQGSRVTFDPIIPDQLSPLIDAGDFGRIPQEIEEWNSSPEDLGKSMDLPYLFRPESKSSFDNSKLSSSEFKTREDYVMAVLASQAHALNVDNPYDDEEIPF